MRMNTSVTVLAACLLALSGAMGFAACGGDESVVGDDGGEGGGRGGDATVEGGGGDGSIEGAGGDGGAASDAPSIDSSPFNDGGQSCFNPGAACKSPGECCSGNCMGGVCGFPPCVSNGGACNGSSQCCTFQCNGGTCASLGSGCLTLGNACQQNGDCCSNRCASGSCQPSSWCSQQGDICAQNVDCCSGNCNLVKNGVGTCGSPPSGASNCGLPDGYLCSGSSPDGGVVLQDGGVPACGGPCCSRACAPWGPIGTLVCQPASGCHVVGDLCTVDLDCCGAQGLPGPVPQGGYTTCDRSGSDGGTYGICRNPTGCKPNGDVCKLKNTSCNASCDCCAGNCEQKDTCKQDNLGVPRCTNAQCTDAGGACSTSADCCNGAPCVPNPVDGGQPPFLCFGSSCVPACAACTTTADCCPGESCVNGRCNPCNPDGGAPPPSDGGPGGDGGGIPDAGCSLYGQICTQNSDCCNGVPCVNGTCHYPIQ